MMEDFLMFVGSIFAAIVVVGGTIVGGVAVYQLAVDKPACEAFGRLAGMETHFSLGTSCLVKSGGEWLDYAVVVRHREQITVKSK